MMKGGVNLTGHCTTDVLHAFTSPSPKLSQYLDATGKVSSGVLDGGTVWLGRYQQCMRQPHARYCLLDIVTDRQQVSGGIRWGVCALSSCNDTDMEENAQWFLKTALPNEEFPFANVSAHCVEQPPIETGFYGTLALFGTLMLLCLVGSFVEWLHKYRVRHHPKLVHKITPHAAHMINADGSTSTSTTSDSSPMLGREEDDDEEWERPPLVSTIHNALKPSCLTLLFTCFSVPYNLRRVLSSSSSGTAGSGGGGSGGAVRCLYGVRVLSIAWVVLGHTYLATYVTGVMANPYDAIAYTKNLLWQPVGNGYYAVDTFFFMSGLLVCYHGLHKTQMNHGKIPLLHFYVHRYVRLTPLVGVIMLLWLYIKPHIAEGPIWYSMAATDTNCNNNWWTNLLYIQNFYPTNSEEQCIGWVWYLALDFQFYLLAPLIIYLLYHYPKQGMAVIGCLILASLVVTAALIGGYNIDIDLTNSVVNMDLQAMSQYESVIYNKPYCRIAPYLVGMTIGYVLHVEQGRNRTIAKHTALSLWLLSFGLCGALTFAFYIGAPFDVAQNISYGTFSHLAWALALAVMVYLCAHGYGGFINSALCWSGWQPLSRLTFGVYMFHPVLQFVIFHAVKTPVYVANITVILYFSAVLLMAFVGSAVFMVLIELPVANLEQLIIGKPPPPVIL